MIENHLWLIRHAKAAARDRVDHERELSYRGYRQCVKMGQFLTTVTAPPQVFLASDARRTLTTAHVLNGFVGGEVVPVEQMYTFGVDVLAAAVITTIADLALEGIRSLAVVGHNSAVSDLIVELSHRSHTPSLPTLGMAELTFTGEWNRLFDQSPMPVQQIVKPSSITR